MAPQPGTAKSQRMMGAVLARQVHVAVHGGQNRDSRARPATLAIITALALTLVACKASAPTVATPEATTAPIAEHPVGPPLPAIELATDPQAAALAEQLLAGGDGARAALDAAIAAAGLGVIDAEGALLAEPHEPSQGLAFGAYEVQALADLEAVGFAQPATDLAEVVAAPLTELDGIPVAAMLMEGVREAAQSESATRRFWAHFFIELGRQGPVGYDLLGEIGAEDVVFDAVQIGFLLRRLQGDLLTVAETATVSLAAYEAPNGRPEDLLQAGKQPCQFDDVETTIDRDDPLVGDVLFGKLIDHLKAQGMAGAAKIPKTRGYAGLMQAYAELLFTAATFKVELTLEGLLPLVRTTSTTEAGERRVLRATARFDLGESSAVVECMQAALDAMGLANHAELPSDGPIPGAEIIFFLVEGKEIVGLIDASPGEVPSALAFRYAATMCGARCEGASGLRDPSGSRGELVITATDRNGRSTIWVEGLPQASDLPDDVSPVEKRASISVAAAVQAKDLWGDVVRRAGVLMPTLMGGTRGVPPAVLNGARVIINAQPNPYVLPVRDWEVGEWDFTMNVASDGPDGSLRADWTGKFSVPVLDVLKGGDIIGTGKVTGELVVDECTVPTDLGGGTKVTKGRFDVAIAADFEMKGRAVVEGTPPDTTIFFELNPLLAEDSEFELPNDPDGCFEIAFGGGILAYIMGTPNELLGPLKMEARDGATADTTVTAETGSIRRQAKIEVADN